MVGAVLRGLADRLGEFPPVGRLVPGCPVRPRRSAPGASLRGLRPPGDPAVSMLPIGEVTDASAARPKRGRTDHTPTNRQTKSTEATRDGFKRGARRPCHQHTHLQQVAAVNWLTGEDE
jgi:hypothetical protein